MADKTFTFAVDDALMTAFGDAAKAQDTTSDELLRQLMHDFVIGHQTDPDYDAWFMQQVEEGIAEADAALYRSKARGKSQLQFHEAGDRLDRSAFLSTREPRKDVISPGS